MIRRAHLFISGLVQGVFFRATTREKARELGLGGWVRNLRDGRVEAVFEGEEDKVRDIISWCYHGPPGARVSGVEVMWEEPTNKATSFDIII